MLFDYFVTRSTRQDAGELVVCDLFIALKPASGDYISSLLSYAIN